MIIKKEAPTIRKRLDSVRPLIDTWMIVDTGMREGTQDVGRDSAVAALRRSNSPAPAPTTCCSSMPTTKSQVRPGFQMPDLSLDTYRVALHDGSPRALAGHWLR
jgi:hypothetical protein